MVRMRKMRLTGCVICLLVLLMQLAPATQVLAAKAIPVPNRRVLVMPFATREDVADANLGANVGHTLVAVLKSTPGFDIVDFNKRHPSLQRAVLVEGTIVDKDLADPSGTGNLELAAKIAREIGADLVIIGDVDSYKYDAAAYTCEIQMTAELIDARSGRMEKAPLIVTGLVPKTAKVATEADCASVAAGNAVNKIAEGLALKAPATMVVSKATAPEPKRKSKKNTLLFSLILGLGVGLAFGGGGGSGSSGSGGGGGIDNPPPAP
ncbi:MAG: hypothetical protein Q7T82_09435 [Armatimonadota bacterium]|nr:hypothetical protein [Armatimonadota bacterium]